MYRPSESRTSKDLELPTSASYGDGSRVSVSLYCDKIIAGGLTATCQVLGAAPSRKLSTSFKGSKANGIIGLGFGLAGSKTPSYPNLVQTLLSENAIKFASFSLIGPRNDPADAAKIDANAIKQPRGFFVIGAVSPDFYTGEIAWCPQTYDSNRWIVKLDAVRINETTAFTDQLALIDTGTALINTSPDTFGKILTLVPDSKLLPSRRMFSYPKSAIETISFVFSEREFKLSQEDLSLGRIKESATDRRCSSICRTGSSQWERCRFPDNLWVIGGIFLDNLVSIFDFEEKKIGFATISDKEDLNSTKYQAVEP